MVAPAPGGYGTFPCPSCGGGLPATMPAGLVIPCYLCHAQITVPVGAGPTMAQAQEYQRWAMTHGNTAAALSDASAPGNANRPFASTSTPVPVDDGAGNILVIGAQVAADGAWRLRAVDPGTRQVRWEALHGARFRSCPEPRGVVRRGGRIYVAHEGVLSCLDSASGALRWQARLGERICTDGDRVPLCGDETMLDEIDGVVVLRTEDDVLHAFAIDGGAPLWQRRDASPFTSGDGVILVKTHAIVELLRPRDGASIARLPAGDGARLPGGVLLEVSGRGPEQDQDGVALIDPATGQERWFVAAEMVDLERGVAVIGGELLITCGSNDGSMILPLAPDGAAAASKPGLFARLFGGGRKPATRALPWKGCLVTGLWAAGDALVVDVVPDGGDERRFAILEPRTMAVRHDSGAIPSGVAPPVAIGPGLVAYAFGESNGAKTLRVVDPVTGAVRWERTFDDLDDVQFRAGLMVLRTDHGPIEVLDPASGQVRASFQN